MTKLKTRKPATTVYEVLRKTRGTYALTATVDGTHRATISEDGPYGNSNDLFYLTADQAKELGESLLELAKVLPPPPPPKPRKKKIPRGKKASAKATLADLEAEAAALRVGGVYEPDEEAGF